MVKKFTEHNGLNLTATNDEVLAEWNKKDIFHKSIDEREGCPQFVFFEGPPFGKRSPGNPSCPCKKHKRYIQQI